MKHFQNNMKSDYMTFLILIVLFCNDVDVIHWGMHRYDFLGIVLVQHVAKYQIIPTTPSKIPLRVKMIQDYYSFN